MHIGYPRLTMTMWYPKLTMRVSLGMTKRGLNSPQPDRVRLLKPDKATMPLTHDDVD